MATVHDYGYSSISGRCLEDKDPKTESGFCPKIMRICCKPGSLEDQDPKSKISKINFASWIRSFCRHLFHPVFLKDQDPKTEPGFSPKIMQIRCTPGSLEDKDNKTEFGFSPKILQKHSKLGSLEDQGPISKISKINFASWIRGFCRHLSHFFFLFRGSGSENCYFQNSFFESP